MSVCVFSAPTHYAHCLIYSVCVCMCVCVYTIYRFRPPTTGDLPHTRIVHNIRLDPNTFSQVFHFMIFFLNFSSIRLDYSENPSTRDDYRYADDSRAYNINYADVFYYFLYHAINILILFLYRQTVPDNLHQTFQDVRFYAYKIFYISNTFTKPINSYFGFTKCLGFIIVFNTKNVMLLGKSSVTIPVRLKLYWLKKLFWKQIFEKTNKPLQRLDVSEENQPFKYNFRLISADFREPDSLPVWIRKNYYFIDIWPPVYTIYA